MLDGRSWTVAEVPQDIPLSGHEFDSVSSSGSRMVGSRQISGAGTTVAQTDPPTVVTQHLQIERQFVIINSKVDVREQSCCCIWQL